METGSEKSELLKIQMRLRENYVEHLKNEFNLLLSNYLEIKEDLVRRDEITTGGDFKEFWTMCFLSLDCVKKLETTFMNFETEFLFEGFIQSLKVEYQPGFWCSVELRLNQNPYIKDEILSRRFNVITNESVTKKIHWVNKLECDLFQFFEDEETDLDFFDVLYDIYVNAVEIYYQK